VVRTVDILPTVCRLEGVEPPEGCIGEPLPGLAGDAAAPPASTRAKRLAYLETFRPRMASNWCELRGLRTDDWTLIDGAACELYDRRRDSGETKNLAARLPAVRDSLLRQLDQTALAAARVKLGHAALELSDEQRERLRSLGYVTAHASLPASTDSLAVWVYPPPERGHALGLPDPRERLSARSDRIVANSYYQAGEALLARGAYAEAAQSFSEAIERDEDLSAAYIGLAESALRGNRHDLATRTLARAGQRFRGDPTIVVAVADAFVRAGRPDLASKVVDDAISAAGRPSPLLRAKRAALERLRIAPPAIRLPGVSRGSKS